MTLFKGKIILETPIYRGNATKTLFSREGDKKERKVAIPGKVKESDVAKSLMDAFLIEPGVRRRSDSGIMGRVWQRLFGENIPDDVIDNISIACFLNDPRTPNERFFDLRMGIGINRDTMAQMKDMNYKMETVYPGSEFEFGLNCSENMSEEHKKKLAQLLLEMETGLMWFGAGKSKGLGKCRLSLDQESKSILNIWKESTFKVKSSSNIMTIQLEFDASHPFLIGWPWGHRDNLTGQEDVWIQKEVKQRREHQEIKKSNPRSIDEIEAKDGGPEFLRQHPKLDDGSLIQYKRNFPVSIANDENFIAFLTHHSKKVHDELSIQGNRDFRVEKNSKRVSQSDMHYDKIFMRMLRWRKVGQNVATTISPDNIDIKKLRRVAFTGKGEQKWKDILSVIDDKLKERLKVDGLEENDKEKLEVQKQIIKQLQDKKRTDIVLKSPATTTASPQGLTRYEESWDVYIPGSTFKGAFRVRSQRVLRTLQHSSCCNLFTPSESNRCPDSCPVCNVFGKQNHTAQVWFSDAYLLDGTNQKEKFASLDAISIDPATGSPIEGSKMDFLYAYGSNLKFKTYIYIENINLNDTNNKFMVGLLAHLLKDFQDGQIHLGGQKTSGMGWVKGKVTGIEIRAKQDSTLFKSFGVQTTLPDGPWQRGIVTWEQFQQSTGVVQSHDHFQKQLKQPLTTIPTFSFTKDKKLASHKAFSGHCGQLHCNLLALSPIHIKESGSPTIDKPELSQGWDFYHISPPGQHAVATEEELINLHRQYTIPSKTIKGMLRMMYSITHNGQVEEAGKFHKMNCSAADSLFGFVQTDTGYMGRLNFSFAPMQEGSFIWYGMPYEYPHPIITFKDIRLFPHIDLPTEVLRIYEDNSQFQEDKNFVPCRCVNINSKFAFTIDFWNLTDDELQDMFWAIQLTPPNSKVQYAHKLGKGKMLGFGSCRIVVDPAQSWEYNWQERYKESVQNLGHVPIASKFFQYARNQKTEAELYKLLTFPSPK